MPDEALFKVTIDGKSYELSRLTLGDMRTLKRVFGVADIDNLSEGDPDFICGMLYLCLVRDGVGHEDALARAENVDLVALAEAGEHDTPAEEESPTEAAPASGKGGGRATPRKKPGNQP